MHLRPQPVSVYSPPLAHVEMAAPSKPLAHSATTLNPGTYKLLSAVMLYRASTAVGRLHGIGSQPDMPYAPPPEEHIVAEAVPL